MSHVSDIKSDRYALYYVVAAVYELLAYGRGVHGGYRSVAHMNA